MGRLTTILLMCAITLLSQQGVADDQDKALELRQSGDVLSLEEILKLSRKQIDGRILEVEMEQKRGRIFYELEILSDDGRVWELKVDATTGEIIDKHQE